MLAQASWQGWIPIQALTGPVLHLGLQYLNRKFDQNRASYFTAHKIQTGSVSRSLLETGWLSTCWRLAGKAGELLSGGKGSSSELTVNL